MYLSLTSFELVKESFVLEAGIEFGGVVDDEDDVGSVDEPLDDIVERIGSIHLLAHLQNARHLHNVDLVFTIMNLCV